MPYSTEQSVGELVRKAERNYISGQTTSSKYVTTSFSEDVNKVYAYLESKHTSGDTDSLGREKPFFNIVLAARNIWFRATDLDRKNIRIKATKVSDTLVQYLATAKLQEWMRKENFGQFLNDWGINSAGFNESVLKFVEQEGRLVPSVVPWNRIICDPIDFDNNPKIEVLELTEAQLRQRKNYDQEMVKKLCDAMRPRETLEKLRKDNKTGYIKLYEVHGNLPLSLLTQNEADEDTYVEQMHVISYLESNEKKDEYDDFTLFSGRENNPYMLTALLQEVDGSISLRGAVKSLFESQWMVNHTQKAIKDQLDLASKLIFQTSDSNFIGQNALSAIETGDILIHAKGEPLTNLANTSHDVASLQAFGTAWKALGNEIVGVSESMLGANPPSGTAWRQTNQLLAESHSLFEIMSENKGLVVEQMLRKKILPFLKKKLDNKDEIVATLDAHGISKIDAIYVNSEAIRHMMDQDINAVLNGQQPQQDMKGAVKSVQDKLSVQGSQRFFKPSDISSKTWKEIFKDLEWEVECDITGEDAPDKDDLTTLTTVLQTIASNPRVLYDPNAKLIFNKILSVAGGMSPLELVESQPFVVPPSKRFTETLDYKDAPEDIKRQMEEQQGFQPSQMQPIPSPMQPNVSAPPGAGSTGLPVK